MTIEAFVLRIFFFVMLEKYLPRVCSILEFLKNKTTSVSEKYGTFLF